MVCNILLEAGADVNATDKWHMDTALHIAAKEGCGAVCEALVSAGANTETVNGKEEDRNRREENSSVFRCKDDGRTALHEAADRGHTAVCEALLAAGAHKGAETKPSNGFCGMWTAARLAKKRGHDDLAKMLMTEEFAHELEEGIFWMKHKTDIMLTPPNWWK